MNAFLILLQAMALMAPQGPTVADVCAGMSGAGNSRTPPAFAAAAAAAEAGDFEKASREFSTAVAKFSAGVEKLFFNGGRADLPRIVNFRKQYSLCSGEGAAKDCKVVAVARRDVLSLRPEFLRWGAYLACRAGDTDTALTLLKTSWRDWADKTSKEDAARLTRPKTEK